MKSRTIRRKRASKSRSARRSKITLAKKVMSFFKGGRMLVSRFASIAF